MDLRFSRLLCVAGILALLAAPAWSGAQAESAAEPDEIVKLEQFARAGTYLGGNYKDSPLFQEIKKRFNVEISVTPASNEVFKEKFRVTLMSGDMPDFFTGMDFWSNPVRHINLLQKEGDYFHPLNDLYHLMPNLTAFYEEYPYVQERFTAWDGNEYGVPAGMAEPVFYHGVGVRKELLDKVGFDLDSVETLDDYLEMMRALYRAHGNRPVLGGVGVRRMMEQPMLWTGRWSRGEYYDTVRDRFGYSFYGEEAKTPVQFMATLYEEGILHPDCITMTDKVLDTGFWDGKWAVAMDAGGIPYGREPKMRETMPDVDWRAVPYPKIGGERVRLPVRFFKAPKTVISATSLQRRKEKIAELVNFFYTEEGFRLAYLGIENEQYVMVDGLPRELYDLDRLTYTFPDGFELPRPLGTPEEYQEWSRNWGHVSGTYDLHMPRYLQTKEHWNNPGENKFVNDYLPKYSSIWSEPPAPLVRFEDEEDRVAQLQNALDTASHEMVAKMIIGQIDVDRGWEELQEKLEQIGVQEFERLYNEAYRRTKTEMQSRKN